MDQAQHNAIVNFIWNIADDVLRDIYVRGKYRDVILPMTVIRRLDCLLEAKKDAILALKKQLDEAGITNQHAALCQVAGQAFYNDSAFTLKRLLDSPGQLTANFEAYLNGYSKNVQEILDKFKFRNQIPTLAEADALGFMIEKFIDPEINLSPNPVLDGEGKIKLPALDNHSMGTIFEELIRRFNEENNEEAGEHFTPRDVVKLMSKLIFLPIADKIESGTYLVYDGACGTGGMLTVAEDTLDELAKEHGKDVSIHLYGQEINPETYAITKSDLLIKGEGDEAENMGFGSTLSNDAFPSSEFDFMLSNPPYGKSWKTDMERMGGKKDFSDSRFIVQHNGDSEYKMLTRSSDGQMMFLVNMLTKMKHNTPLGSRIAEVHNGSSLFTGDAGQGESNVRRWIIENDWLEAIIALPLNMFYNTGIATYIWVIGNRKPEHRKGKVQLIDATKWYQPLRKNLGKKNCEFSDDDIKRIMDAFLAFVETEESKLFPNEAFGYRKITVERPLRLRSQFTRHAVEGLRFASGDEALRKEIYARFGQKLYDDFSVVKAEIDQLLIGSEDNGDEEDTEDNPTKKKTVPEKVRKKLLDPNTWTRDHRLYQIAKDVWKKLGDKLFEDHNEFRLRFDDTIKELGLKLGPADKKVILRAVSWRDESAPPVIGKREKPKPGDDSDLQRLYGRYHAEIDGEHAVLEYEPDTDLRDTEQVPLLEEGGIEAFFKREVLPHMPDAWIDAESIKIGYEVSFTRYFYKPQPLRTLEEIRADIEALEKETEGMLSEIIGGKPK
jgi:type I restriction enzyme M protein